MKKVVRLLPLILLLFAVSQAQAAMTSDQLVGTWVGKIDKNIVKKSGGGNPNVEKEATPVTIQFSKSAKGLSGTSEVKGSKEQWTIEGDTYTWKDDDMTVTTKQIPLESVAPWIQTHTGLKTGEPFMAFKYDSCKMNKGQTPCQLPSGLEKSGVWLFHRKGNTLYSGVFYKYPDPKDGERVLLEKLELSK